MNILITGADGFIGKNMRVHLQESDSTDVLTFTKHHGEHELEAAIENSDFICHFAGTNRPANSDDFTKVNAGLTDKITSIAAQTGRSIPILFTSSTQAELDNPYGRSKKDAENILIEYSTKSGSPVYIYRLPNVFGKWSRPEYNSVVATFCHYIANNLPIDIHDESTLLSLVYIDDVVEAFCDAIAGHLQPKENYSVEPVYNITVGELATQLQRFQQSRDTLVSEAVGTGLTRVLYATYLSYLKPAAFSYPLFGHKDERGIFVEFLKTKDSGQMSFFTAKPGVTRGSHYHHTKTEKFLVVQGNAAFGFRHIETGEQYQLRVSSDKPEVVESIPGWAHDITNTGSEELVVMLWANEIFDESKPDTIGTKINEQ